MKKTQKTISLDHLKKIQGNNIWHKKRHCTRSVARQTACNGQQRFNKYNPFITKTQSNQRTKTYTKSHYPNYKL